MKLHATSVPTPPLPAAAWMVPTHSESLPVSWCSRVHFVLGSLEWVNSDPTEPVPSKSIFTPGCHPHLLHCAGAVPVLGQAAQGMSASLGGVSSWLGAAGTSARQAARGLGVPGLDVGAGCGVLAGYYFGAGKYAQQ